MGAGPVSPASRSSNTSTALGSIGNALPSSACGDWGGELGSSWSRVSDPWWVRALCRQPAKAKRRRVQVAVRATPVLSWGPANRQA